MKVSGKWVDDSGEPLDMYDLKGKIVASFKTVDDLEALSSQFDNLTEDELINALIGLKIFCEMRVRDIDECWERVMHNMREDLADDDGDVTDSVHERTTEHGSSGSNNNSKPDSLLPEGL